MKKITTPQAGTLRPKAVIAANWKMNKTREQAHLFFKEFATKNLKSDRDVVFCVPFTNLAVVREYADEIGFATGAQNFHPAKNGAFTGEISAEMLCEIGTRVVLVGHSERRAIFGETDAFVNEKVKSALGAGLYVLLCVGETLDEREKNKTNTVLARQLDKGLEGIKLPKGGEYVLAVAYEPVWAIGTGRVATTDQIRETHAFVRHHLEKMYPDVFVPILYGGSANEKNAGEILGIKNVDGVLVGGASLDVDKFTAIINS